MSKATTAQPASPLSRWWHQWRFHLNILLLLVPLGFMPKYFADASNLKLAVQEGQIDVATRSLSPTDIQDLSTKYKDKVNVVKGPGGEVRLLTFNMKIQQFGSSLPDADPAMAMAVRQAVANLIDRIAPELNADRMVFCRRKHVDDATAYRELTTILDQIYAVVGRRG